MFIELPNTSGIADTSIVGIVVNILNWVISFSAVVSVVMIIVSGYQFMFAGGDERRTKRATSSLISAILGMILVFIAPLVIQFIIDKFLE